MFDTLLAAKVQLHCELYVRCKDRHYFLHHKPFCEHSVQKHYITLLSKIIDRESITYNHNIMVNIEEEYGEIARTYLAVLKERTQYYQIKYICSNDGIEFWTGMQAFSDAEMASLKRLRDKYGDSQFFNHLDDAFDPKTLNEIAPDEIVHFDLDDPQYLYDFNCHFLTPEGMQTLPVKVQLSDETYAKLLVALLADCRLNINKLKYANKEVYDQITHEVDLNFASGGIFSAKYPYLITLDEAIADAQKIKEYYNNKTYPTESPGYLIQ